MKGTHVPHPTLVRCVRFILISYNKLFRQDNERKIVREKSNTVEKTTVYLIKKSKKEK